MNTAYVSCNQKSITMNLNLRFLTGALFMLPVLMLAQSPVSGFMKTKGDGSITASFSSEKYDEVFLVPQKVDGVPVFNEVKTTSYSLYAEYGISDNFNLVFNLPYIKSEGQAIPETLENTGYENERKGLQDVSIYGKYRFASKATPNGMIDFIAAAGIETPLGDYRVDEALQSIIAIGNRSTDITGLAIASYKHNNGIFITGQIGYSLRSNSVPNALLSEVKLGYAASKFYLEGYVANQLSDDSGVDILGEGFNGFFPATRVNYTRLGFNAYVPVCKSVGLSGGYSNYIEGRNLGDADGFNWGVTYSF
ncbi:hypothetical protein DSM02_2847 [Leeuwenhoekiella polynyae]|uniref:Uncharacterized protein n=2 Tax=Leeuwenhoekiella polynyae TaxID=1550906 RepID=A0A4V1KQ32_9FLAO|nr:hypothetical protein DSM02_2847 [Leeuwenhoekiella polynyae]